MSAKVLITTRVVVGTKVVFQGGKLHVVTDTVRVVVNAALEKAAARSDKELVFESVEVCESAGGAAGGAAGGEAGGEASGAAGTSPSSSPPSSPPPSPSTSTGDEALSLDELLGEYFVLVDSVRDVIRPLAAAARRSDFVIDETCTFGELLQAVQKECSVDWAQLQEMMHIFEGENYLMHREGIIHFI